MRLTRKDALATVLVLAGLAMALSVMQGWNWPLLNGVRAGVVALGIAGFAACLLGSSLESFYFNDPYGVLTFVIAIATISVSIVGGLIFGTQEFLLVLMFATAMLWLLGTLRHAVEGQQVAPVRRIFG